MKPKRKVNCLELMALGFFHCGGLVHALKDVGGVEAAECHPFDQEQLQMWVWVGSGVRGGARGGLLNLASGASNCPPNASDHISISL